MFLLLGSYQSNKFRSNQGNTCSCTRPPNQCNLRCCRASLHTRQCSLKQITVSYQNICSLFNQTSLSGALLYMYSTCTVLYLRSGRLPSLGHKYSCTRSLGHCKNHAHMANWRIRQYPLNKSRKLKFFINS